jgi:hypothetical protein
LRQGTKIGTAAAPYGAGTRVAVHRSRFELERTLGRYGASDFALVEADATASIQFAMQGRYVQLALPLPDPNDTRFTKTPSGRPRTVVAQERAYEQALREHWRALLLAVRGKLQSVETGISTFEHEFAGFLVSQPHAERRGKKGRKKPKAVNWLLGSSHTVAIALVAAFLVPASAVGAFALPPSVVDNLSAPFRSALPDEVGSGGGGSHSVTIALGSNGWTSGVNDSDFSSRRRGPASTVAPASAAPQASDQLAETALASAAEEHVPVASQSADIPPAPGGGSGSSSSQQTASGKPGGGANPPAAPESGGAPSSPPAPPDENAPGEAAGPSGGGNEAGPSAGGPAAGDEESSGGTTADEPGDGNGEGNNGNHGDGNNGNGNSGNGNNGNGNGNANAPADGNNGNGNANPPANANGNNGNAGGNGNGNGNANPPANANGNNANGNSGNGNNGNGNNGNGNNGNGNNGNGNGNAGDPANPGKGKAKATP